MSHVMTRTNSGGTKSPRRVVRPCSAPDCSWLVDLDAPHGMCLKHDRAFRRARNAQHDHINRIGGRWFLSKDWEDYA